MAVCVFSLEFLMLHLPYLFALSLSLHWCTYVVFPIILAETRNYPSTAVLRCALRMLPVTDIPGINAPFGNAPSSSIVIFHFQQ